MGLKKHGITSETIKNMILGAGVIYKNLKYEKPSNSWTGTPLGATSGGLKFNYDCPGTLYTPSRWLHDHHQKCLYTVYR